MYCVLSETDSVSTMKSLKKKIVPNNVFVNICDVKRDIISETKSKTLSKLTVLLTGIYLSQIISDIKYVI